MIVLCKNIILSHGKIDFYLSSKIQILQLVTTSPVKTKTSEFSETYGNCSQEEAFAKKKLMKLRTCGCTPGTSFHSSP